MTLLEAMTFLRESYLDDTGGIGIDWSLYTQDDIESAQLRWTNEELTSHINEAVRQACRRALLILDYNSAFDIDVSAGTTTYPFDTRILRIKGARLDSDNTYLTPYQIEDVFVFDDWGEDEATPTAYYVNFENDTIELNTKPLIDDTIHLLVYRLPLTDLSWSTPSGSIELRDEHVIPMLSYAAYLAFSKPDANTYDPEMANKHLAIFTQEFTFVSAYSEERKRRTVHRAIKYGGL